MSAGVPSMPTPIPPSAAPRRAAIEPLTGLRFIAAAMIVAFHYAPRPPGLLVRNGFLGVGLFFILSGFVLAYSYIDDEGAVRGTTRDFWLARVARIYPVYLIGLALALPAFIARVAADPVAHSPAAPTSSILAAVVSTLLLSQAWIPVIATEWNYPAWSLSCEAFFYLAFPFLAPVLARAAARWPARVLALCWLVALVPPASYALARPDGIAHATFASWGVWLSVLKYDPAVRFAEFAFGIALGVVFVRHRAAWAARAHLASIMLGAGLVAVIVGVVVAPYPLLHNGLLAPAFGAIVVALALDRAHGIAALMASVTFRRLGEASYAMYIVHAPVHDAWARWNPLRGRGLSPWASFAAYGVALLIVAVVIERVVGEPARRVLRRRWIDRRRVTATGVAERDASVAARRPGGSIPAVASSRASDSATLVAAESGR